MLLSTSVIARPGWRRLASCRFRGQVLQRCAVNHAFSSRVGSGIQYSARRRFMASHIWQRSRAEKVLPHLYCRTFAVSNASSPDGQTISGNDSPSTQPSPNPLARKKRTPTPPSPLAAMQLEKQAQEAAAAAAAAAARSGAAQRSPRASRMTALDPAAVLPKFKSGLRAGQLQPGVLTGLQGTMPTGPTGGPPSARAEANAQMASSLRPQAMPRATGMASSPASEGMPGRQAGHSVRQVMAGAGSQAQGSAARAQSSSSRSKVPIPQNGDTVTGRVVAVRDDYALVELFGLGRGMTGVLEHPHVTRVPNPPPISSILQPGLDIKALVINAALRTVQLSTAQLEATAGDLVEDPAAFLANADAVWLREFQSKGGTIIAPGKLPPPDAVTGTATSTSISATHPVPAATPEVPSSPASSSTAATSSSTTASSSSPRKMRTRGSLFGKKRQPAAASSATPSPLTPSAAGGITNSDRVLRWKALEDMFSAGAQEHSSVMAEVQTMTKLLSGYSSSVPDTEKAGIRSAVQQWVAAAGPHVPTMSGSELASVAAIWVLLEQKQVNGVQDQTMGAVGEPLPAAVVTFLTRMAIAAQPHMRTMSGHDLVCVLGAAGVTIPGKVAVEWLMEAEIASFSSLGNWSGDNLATAIYALDQLGTPLKWAPNKAWLDAWVAAAEPKLVTMVPRALSRAIKGLSAFKHKPSDDWVMKYNVAYQSRLKDMAPEDMANTLIGMAQLGIGMGGQQGMPQGFDGGSDFGFDSNMPFPDFDEDMLNGMPGQDGFKDMFDAMGGPGGADMFQDMMGGAGGADMFKDRMGASGGADVLKNMGGAGGPDMFKDVVGGPGGADMFNMDDEVPFDEDAFDEGFAQGVAFPPRASSSSGGLDAEGAQAESQGQSKRKETGSGSNILQAAEFTDLPKDVQQPSS